MDYRNAHKYEFNFSLMLNNLIQFAFTNLRSGKVHHEPRNQMMKNCVITFTVQRHF